MTLDFRRASTIAILLGFLAFAATWRAAAQTQVSPQGAATARQGISLQPPAVNQPFALPIDASINPTLGPPPTTDTTSLPKPSASAPSGEVIQAVGGAVATPAAPGAQAPPALSAAPPFGSQLFVRQPQLFGPVAFNRDYIVAPGDQLEIQVYGSYNYSGVQGVDPQGNIFIPQVGPIRVAGESNRELNFVVTNAVKRVFTQNVDVYSSLLSKQPVAVYVTGAVKSPGRYSGDRLDSPLQYIAQAGGIDNKSGSYRDIRVMRGGRTLARIDLYAFLTGTELPPTQFDVNDQIVIGFQRPTVTVLGDVQNKYRFELDPQATGAAIAALARPDPTVSNVSIQGVRDGKPYNAYVGLAEFLAMRPANGDTFEFKSDYVADTIFVNVTGQSNGPSAFVVPRSARLGELLRLIEVDPAVADLDAIYLRRQSVVQQQQQALDASLDQLRRSVLTTRSVTTSDAAIHTEEAKLVEQFLLEVRAFRPQGVVVLATARDRDRIMFEPNDQIVIPAKSDVVLVTGEVRIPQSLIYTEGRPLLSYAEKAGGFTDRADTSSYVLLHPSGEVETGGDQLRIRPGDQIMVMPRIDSHDFAIMGDLVHILYEVAVSSGVAFKLTGVVK
jgi:protein involved in polysaccharide export with SLBB domain